MEHLYGVVIGIVTDVADPEDMGRIKLRFPWLAQEGADSGWAPIAKPMAGKSRGYHYLPEIDDEALVAFEHGNIDHPMVLGFLHNGVDQPPDDGVDRHVRRLESVAGHVLELDDRSGRESLRLHTSNGHQLELHDPDARHRAEHREGPPAPPAGPTRPDPARDGGWDDDDGGRHSQQDRADHDRRASP